MGFDGDTGIGGDEDGSLGAWSSGVGHKAEEVLEDDMVMTSREGEPTGPRDWIGGGQCN
jgi:hypothetical protein